MISRSAPGSQFGEKKVCVTPERANVRMVHRAMGRGVRFAGIAAALVVCALAQPATAWWPGHGFSARVPGGYAWGPGPWVLFPSQRPRPDYRYSVPPGAPLSYDDPASGTTYCWSQTTGFYFACAYAPPVALVGGPVPPPPPALSPHPDLAVPPAPGVLLFRLPQGAQAAIDGVPIGLSDGVGIHSLAPGRHQVVVQVSGKETAHTVEVRSHRILTVTPTGVVATEP
jgi:hypothetical protein